MLTVNNLIIQREGRAIHPALSFVIKKGEIWWLKGPNGCGKSSLLKAILGWLPHPGVMIDEGVSVGYLGHQTGLPHHLSVWEHCVYHPSIQQFDAVKCQKILEQLELMPFKHRRIGVLSAGQKQRLSLVPLMLSQATLWLLDEPFTAMDAASTLQIKSLLKKNAEQGVGILVVSHDDLSDWATHTLPMGVKHACA